MSKDLVLTERGVIQAILLDDAVYYRRAVSRGITEASFRDPLCRAVWTQITLAAADGRKADAVTIGDRMPSMVTDLMSLMDSVPSFINFPEWLDNLREREAAEIAGKACKSAIDALTRVDGRGKPFGEILGGIASAVTDCQQIQQRETVQTLRDQAKELVRRAKAGSGEELTLFPYHTEGWHAVKLHPGELMTLCALSGKGKTAFACGCVRELLRQGKRVVYICTESDSAAILARITSAFCGVHHSVTYAADRAGKDEFDGFFGQLAGISKKYMDKLIIAGCESGIVTPSAIETLLDGIELKRGHVDALIIDYFQQLQPPRHLIKESRNEQLVAIASELNMTAQKHRTAAIILSQMNREAQKGNILPNLSHVKDSGGIVESSSIVAFLHRYTDAGAQRTKFYSDKTRNIKPFCMDLDFDGVGFQSATKY